MHHLVRNVIILMISGLSIIAISCSSKREKKVNESGSPSVQNKENSQHYWLFVGTYTRKEGHVDGQAKGLYWYGLDTATKKIELIDTYKDIVNPSYLTISPDKHYIYAISETNGDSVSKYGQVYALRINTSDRKLELINKQSSKGDYPCYISTDHNGNIAMVANYGTGNIAVFPLNKDGSLDPATSVMQHEGEGPVNGRQDGPHAHMIVAAPNNNFLLSNDLGTDKIYSYPVDYRLSVLTKQQVAARTHPGAGPRHLVFHPSKKNTYVVNELNGTIEAFHYNDTLGILERFQTISTVDEGENGEKAGCADIHITPNGSFLYASNRSGFNNIAAYKVSEKDGHLSFIGHQSVKGKTPRNFLISPDGKFLLVANQDSNNIVYFIINQKTGALIDPNIEMEVPTPVCLKIIPAK
jgi:6-phosphogluconolactonase